MGLLNCLLMIDVGLVMVVCSPVIVPDTVRTLYAIGKASCSMVACYICYIHVTHDGLEMTFSYGPVKCISSSGVDSASNKLQFFS